MQREATCAVSLCPVQHMQKAQRCPEPQIKKQRSPVWSSRGRGRPGRVGAQSATISLEVAGAEITFRRPPGRLRRNAEPLARSGLQRRLARTPRRWQNSLQAAPVTGASIPHPGVFPQKHSFTLLSTGCSMF